MLVSGFALVDGDSNVIESWQTIPTRINLPNGHELFGAAVGWTDGTYSIVERQWDNVSQSLDFLQFYDLFTSSEQLAIAGSSDAGVKLWIMRATGAPHIELTNATVQEGIAYLVSKELLTSERAAAILNNEPPA